MFTRDITFEDLDGQMVTQQFHFNLTEAEAVEMNFARQGGIEAYVAKIVAAESFKELIELFKELIQKTYGVRDGNRFVKNQDLTDEFEQTGAYSSLFIELATNEKSAIQFFKGVMPKNMQARVDEATNPVKKEYSDAELQSIPWDDFYESAGGRNDQNWDKRHMLAAFRRKSAGISA